MKWWQFAISILAFSSVIFLCLSMIALRLTLDRRVRRSLPMDKKYDAYPDWYFGFGRAIGFGSASIFDFANNSDAINNFYNGFDVKNFATVFEKSLGWIMIASLFVAITTSILYCILDWLGLWP